MPQFKGALAVLFVAVAAASASFEGVDPNKLSCDPKGLEFLLLPHHTHCDKFYMCVHGNEVEFPCAAGTIFDFPLQTCNHAWATPCWLRDDPNKSSEEVLPPGLESSEEEGSGDPEGSGEIEDASSATSYIHLTALKAGHAVLNCLESKASSRQIPYVGNCQRYWKCANGLPKAFFCTDGLFFNPRTEQCDFEANVTCVAEEQDELAGEFMMA